MIRFLTFLLICGAASAHTIQNIEHVGRYARLRPAPIVMPLDTTIAARFVAPTNVGDAVTLILQPTGYQLVNGVHAPALQSNLLGLRLPEAHRDFTGHRAIDALVAIAKPGYRVVVDHVHRLVAFEPRPQYRQYAAYISATAQKSTTTGEWRCTRLGTQHRCVPERS